MSDVQTTERHAQRGLSRRDMIKGAAAAGTAAWTAPVILGSLASPAAASSLQSGCYKYMFNGPYASEIQACAPSKGFSIQNTPVVECAPSLAENRTNQIYPNPNCCQDKSPFGPGGDGGVLQWYQVPDFDANCITVTPTVSKANCTTGYIPQWTFTMTNACPNCYFADICVYVTELSKLGDCDTIAVSSNCQTTSEFTRQWTVTIDPGYGLVWAKMWVACSLVVGSPQYVPNTQSSCLPGGQPVTTKNVDAP